jgi:hypothetical protein
LPEPADASLLERFCALFAAAGEPRRTNPSCRRGKGFIWTGDRQKGFLERIDDPDKNWKFSVGEKIITEYGGRSPGAASR